jgi:hypothetical protein
MPSIMKALDAGAVGAINSKNLLVVVVAVVGLWPERFAR